MRPPIYMLSDGTEVRGELSKSSDMSDKNLENALLAMLDLKNATRGEKRIPLSRHHIRDLFKIVDISRPSSSTTSRQVVSEWRQEEKFRIRHEFSRIIDYIFTHQRGMEHLAQVGRPCFCAQTSPENRN